MLKWFHFKHVHAVFIDSAATHLHPLLYFTSIYFKRYRNSRLMHSCHNAVVPYDIDRQFLSNEFEVSSDFNGSELTLSNILRFGGEQYASLNSTVNRDWINGLHLAQLNPMKLMQQNGNRMLTWHFYYLIEMKFRVQRKRIFGRKSRCIHRLFDLNLSFIFCKWTDAIVNLPNGKAPDKSLWPLPIRCLIYINLRGLLFHRPFLFCEQTLLAKAMPKVMRFLFRSNCLVQRTVSLNCTVHTAHCNSVNAEHINPFIHSKLVGQKLMQSKKLHLFSVKLVEKLKSTKIPNWEHNRKWTNLF